MYPAFKHDIRPTPVHLQVYDGKSLGIAREDPFLTASLSLDAAHILPVLFPFTTLGKYCYRAMALFSMHVIDVPNHNTSPLNEILTPPDLPPKVHTSQSQRAASSVTQGYWWSLPSPQGTSEPRMHSENDVRVTPNSQDLSAEVAGPSTDSNPGTHAEDVPKAGEASVYAGIWVIKNTIRRTNFTLTSNFPAGQIRRRLPSSSHDPRARLDPRYHPPTRARVRTTRDASTTRANRDALGTRIAAVH